MRRANIILSALILVLLMAHGILGAYQLTGAGTYLTKGLNHLLLTLVAIHAALGVKFTFDALRVIKKSGAAYLRHNVGFWVSRISGVCILALLAFHVVAFTTTNGGAVRLNPFTTGPLVTQLLLVAAILLHIVTNVKPLFRALGVNRWRPAAQDALFVCACLLLVMAAAFIVYYIRWTG